MAVEIKLKWLIVTPTLAYIVSVTLEGFGSCFSDIINTLQVQRDFIDGDAVSFHILETKLEQERAQEAARNAQLQHSINWLSIDDKDQETEWHARTGISRATKFLTVSRSDLISLF